MNAKFDKEETRWSGLYTNKAYKWALFPKAATKRVTARKQICLDWLQGEKVIDIGCNGGHYGLEIAKTRKWHGLDISKEMLFAGRQRFTEAHLKGQFINGSITALPCKDSLFDSAICIGVINYFKLSKLNSIFKDINRIIVPGGQFIFTNLSLDVFTWIRSRLPASFPRPIRVPGPLYPHPKKGITDLLLKNGFTITQTKLLKKYKFFPYITLTEATKTTSSKKT